MGNLRKYGQPPYGVAVIHGGPGAPGEMAPVARELSKTCGVLEPLQSRDTLIGQLEELVTTLRDHASLPVVLIGHSWGATLSFILAAHHPPLVRKLILVSSAVFEEKYATGIMETRLSRLSEEDRSAVGRLLNDLDDPAGKDEKRTFAQLKPHLGGAEPRDRQPDITHPAPGSDPDPSKKNWAFAQTSERLDVGGPPGHELDITHLTPGPDPYLSKKNTAFAQLAELMARADSYDPILDITTGLAHSRSLSDTGSYGVDSRGPSPGAEADLARFRHPSLGGKGDFPHLHDPFPTTTGGTSQPRSPLVDIKNDLADSHARLPDIRHQISDYRARQFHITGDIIEFQYHIYENVWRDACEIRNSGDLLCLGQRIKCPVVGIHGEWDPHPADGVRIPLSNVVDDFRFILLDCCGHSPWYERQARERFYALIKEELQM